MHASTHLATKILSQEYQITSGVNAGADAAASLRGSIRCWVQLSDFICSAHWLEALPDQWVQWLEHSLLLRARGKVVHTHAFSATLLFSKEEEVQSFLRKCITVLLAHPGIPGLADCTSRFLRELITGPYTGNRNYWAKVYLQTHAAQDWKACHAFIQSCQVNQRALWCHESSEAGAGEDSYDAFYESWRDSVVA